MFDILLSIPGWNFPEASATYKVFIYARPKNPSYLFFFIPNQPHSKIFRSASEKGRGIRKVYFGHTYLPLSSRAEVEHEQS